MNDGMRARRHIKLLGSNGSVKFGLKSAKTFFAKTSVRRFLKSQKALFKTTITINSVIRTANPVSTITISY